MFLNKYMILLLKPIIYIVLKINYQLIESLKIKNVNKIVTYGFTDLLNNINLNDLYNIVNDLFKKIFY